MIKLTGFSEENYRTVAKRIKGQEYYLFEEDLMSSGMDHFMNALYGWLTDVGMDTTSVAGDAIVQKAQPMIMAMLQDTVAPLIEELGLQGLQPESIAASRIKRAQSAEDVVDAVMGTVPPEFAEFIKPLLSETVNQVVSANPEATVDEIMEIVEMQVEQLIEQGPPEGTQFEENPMVPNDLDFLDSEESEELSPSEEALFNQLFG